MKYNLELTMEEVNTIVAGLGKLPAEQSFNLIIFLQNELEKQTSKEEDGSENVG